MFAINTHNNQSDSFCSSLYDLSINELIFFKELNDLDKEDKEKVLDFVKALTNESSDSLTKNNVES